MNILKSLFGISESKKQEIPIQKPKVSKVIGLPPIEESLSNLAIEVIGASTQTSLMPLKDNHQLEEEYEKLKDLGLISSANARLIKVKLDSINKYNDNIKKARDLKVYIRNLNYLYDGKAILISRESFYTVCRKYNLDIGPLKNYTGVIPVENLEELSKVKSTGQYHSNIYVVTNVKNYSDITDRVIRRFLEQNYYIFFSHKCISTLSNISPWGEEAKKVYLHCDWYNEDDFFIACPKEHLKKDNVTISNHPIDPIVFRFCEYGIVIHTMWGKESEDKVFEEYKRLNNLI